MKTQPKTPDALCMTCCCSETLQACRDAKHQVLLISELPNFEFPCYDCGSTVPGHHSTLCDIAEDQQRDLPCMKDLHPTFHCPQSWIGSGAATQWIAGQSRLQALDVANWQHAVETSNLELDLSRPVVETPLRIGDPIDPLQSELKRLDALATVIKSEQAPRPLAKPFSMVVQTKEDDPSVIQFGTDSGNYSAEVKAVGNSFHVTIWRHIKGKSADGPVDRKRIASQGNWRLLDAAIGSAIIQMSNLDADK